MAEREFQMQPVGVEYVCDKCGEGLMEPHGNVAWLTDPIQFPHRCNKCGHEQAFSEKYPALRWKRTTAGVAAGINNHSGIPNSEFDTSGVTVGQDRTIGAKTPMIPGKEP